MLGKIIYLRHCELTGKDKLVRLFFFGILRLQPEV